jgi:hypothetical protein
MLTLFFLILFFMKIRYEIYIYIYIYIYATFQRKLYILIPDLYFYNIKIQTNINQN